jgi:hypothetical protein
MINASTMTGGTINGTYINTEKDINVGNNMNIGDPDTLVEKGIYFYNNSTVGDTCNIHLNEDGSLSINSFQAVHINQGGGNQITIDDGMIYLNGSVIGLESSRWTQPGHNHGIPNGTRLAICDTTGKVTGSVLWTESGGFTHWHDIY